MRFGSARIAFGGKGIQVFFFFFFLIPIYYYTRYIISGMQPCGYGLRNRGRIYLSVCNDKGTYMVGSCILFWLWCDCVLLDGFSQSNFVECKYLDELG